MAKRAATFLFTAIQMRRANMAYAVAVERPDGVREAVGTVAKRWFAHLEMHGWEATGADGHRAVHLHRWQAAMALVWDGKGYPFPFLRPAD